MSDLSVNFCGLRSPNPFWLASGPPTNTGGQVMRAFDAGWGGAVWKTIGDPIQNTSSRYGAIDLNGVKMMGLNNIELISDRPIAVNLREIAEVKKRYPKNLVIASLMVESKRETWHDIVRRAEDAGSDALELNFGCPHGMSERGMGAAVGQVPEYTEMITSWAKEVAKTPVISKLTPNVTDITHIALAAERGGADAVSLINTINSLMGVDLETFAPRPNVAGKSSHGGYCGPAVKPIALAPAFQRREKSKNSHRRHRWHRRLEGRRRTHRPRRHLRASLHRRHALRLSHRRRHGRRPRRLHGRPRLQLYREFSWPRRCQRNGLGRPRPELQNHRQN